MSAKIYLRRKSVSSATHSTSPIPLDELLIKNYLENPTKTGLWSLKATKTNHFNDFIKSELKVFLKSLTDPEDLDFEEQAANEEFKNDILRSITRYSFVLSLFASMYHDEMKIDSLDYIRGNDAVVINKLDFDMIREQYADAYSYFKKNIFYDNFKPGVYGNEITRLKKGFVISWHVKDDRKSVRFIDYEDVSKQSESTFLSLDKSSLEVFMNFFEKIGFSTFRKLMPVFSPEEEVFGPYVIFLQQLYSKLVDHATLERFFKNSISEYKDDNFSHCISTVGLITEDILIQIYETLFRDICPKGLTLGQLYDRIHVQLRTEFDVGEKKLIEYKKYYDQIATIKANFSASKDELFVLLRDIVSLVKNVQKSNDLAINEIKNPDKQITVFNKSIRENVREIIKNRNAISHRSRIPIGNYEALRSLYCCVTLMLWWKNQKDSIDWSKSSKEILTTMVANNSNC